MDRHSQAKSMALQDRAARVSIKTAMRTMMPEGVRSIYPCALRAAFLAASVGFIREVRKDFKPSKS